jgi:hypothetical protein
MGLHLLLVPARERDCRNKVVLLADALVTLYRRRSLALCALTAGERIST